MFLYKNLFFQYLLLFQSQSCLLESMAAIFRQSAGYVIQFLASPIFCVALLTFLSQKREKQIKHGALSVAEHLS